MKSIFNKPYFPLVLTLVISIVLNAIPYLGAFVLNLPGWVQTAWVFYFFTIPIGAVLVLVGIILTIILYRKQSKS